MNSERQKRKTHAAQLDEQIRNLESIQTKTAQQLDSLRLAQRTLSEPIRPLDECEMLIHTFQPHGYQEADCSACGNTVIWEMNAEFCYRCGSRVVKAEKEQDPRDRMARVAIKEAASQLIGD